MLGAELHARGRWRLAFERQAAVKLGFVVEGECVIALRGRSPERLRAGDAFLLGGPPPFFLASDVKAPIRNGNALLGATKRHIVTLGRAHAKPAVHIIGGHFILDPTNAHLLVDALPPLVRIPAAEAWPLRGILPLLVDEVRAAHLGRTRALDQLAQLALTYALRWLDSEGASPARAGWLRALADARIGAAIRHIHAHVEQGTSLGALARVAGMSRTVFASRFKALVGMPPLAYGIQWRMSLAKDALRTSDRPIGALAFTLGYASESAFSTAFRRAIGCSPRAYRRRSAQA